MEKSIPEISNSQAQIVKILRKEMKQQFYGESTGHDWHHIERVWKMARRITRGENKPADLFLIEISALVHDVGDWKFHEEGAAERMIREILAQYNIEERIITAAIDIVDRISFKGAGVADDMPSYEGQIVQDADRLDALGAIGIARTFSYGGYKGISLYDPEKPAVLHNVVSEYRRGSASSINHFYEKLLLLKKRMHTKTAKKIAEDRHGYMEQFLKRFYREWEGNL